MPNMSKVREANGQNQDDDVEDWIPPTDQIGDGKTSLNEKFGYWGFADNFQTAKQPAIY